MNKKLVASLLAVIVGMQSSLYASNQGTILRPMDQPMTQENIEGKDSFNTQEEIPILTLQEAITKGLENSLILKGVENKADIAEIIKKNSIEVRNDLEDAYNDLNHASYLIHDGREEVYQAANNLDTAEEALKNGLFPITISCKTVLQLLADNETVKMQFQGLMKMLGLEDNSILGQAGTSIHDFCMNHPVGKTLASLGYGETFIEQALKKELEHKSGQLAASQKKLEASTEQYLMGDAEYQASLKYALSSVSNKLSTNTISSLDSKPLGELIVKMCNKQDELTSYAIDIYRNQIALLIENSYVKALKEQELLTVKKKAEERGKVQYEMAKAAYQVGLKSKDEMIIAKTYYNAAIMNTALQNKGYQEALVELKKNMNIEFDETFNLETIQPEMSELFDLNTGIQSGLRTRLELKMTQATEDMYDYLMTALDHSGYDEHANQYKEVKLLIKQVQLENEGKKVEIESQIRNSYQAMETTKMLVEKAKVLRESAEETLEMAKMKYEEGYGSTNSLLASLNLEQMSGTMVEVLAAEENLENIKEKEIEAMASYHLARLKYLNDIGVMSY